jgi:lysophospholipase L1-like esterase
MRHFLRLVALACATPGAVLAAVGATPLKFDFGSSRVAFDYVAVSPDMTYTADRGFGFEAGPSVVAVDRGGDARIGDFVTAEQPFQFTARVPREGNYRVTVTLGDPAGASVTTIKAELRRLMIETHRTAAGGTSTVSFIVNVRTPRIAAVDGIAAGEVRLKAPRETTQEARAWDTAITLEFGDARPAVASVEIAPVDVPTVFLLGDSTVCDQSKEPYNSWGQMFTRWFVPEVAIANHGESGETYRDSIGRRRLDKILSLMRPGDWLLMQFGHNDQKQIANNSGGPFTTYKAEIKRHVEGARSRGGIPVILSPMERRGFDATGKVKPSLIDYANAAREVARELGVAFIDLNALSKPFYEALGPERSARAFAAPGGKVDNTHHNNYGSYQMSRAVAQALRDQALPLARFLRPDFPGFDPARPDDPDAFSVPASGEFASERPLGDEGR